MTLPGSGVGISQWHVSRLANQWTNDRKHRAFSQDHAFRSLSGLPVILAAIQKFVPAAIVTLARLRLTDYYPSRMPKAVFLPSRFRSKIHLALLTFKATQFVAPRPALLGVLFAPESRWPPRPSTLGWPILL